ncbi:MAG: hypothetical protein ACJ74H_18450 [Thermoanaerobaculia bacterium]
MDFLDEVPLHRDDPKIVQLHEILIRAYDEEYDALALAGQVGMLKADIERYPKLRETWWSILEESAREGQLRKLVDVALRDPTRENWHVQIRAVVEVPAGSLLPETPAAAPETPAQKRQSSKTPEVGSSADLWEIGTTLRVRFLDGSKRLQARVEAAAMQWVEYANLKFEFGDDPDAQIRVTFKADPGSWAYQGKTALSIPAKQPTVNFGWLKADTPSDEIDRTVLHEFGHVLGLQHEHGNPASTLKWKKEEVYRDLSSPPNNWSRELVDRHIFAIWPPAYFPVHKVFDRQSIMMYEMKPTYFVKGEAIGKNQELSAVDKQFAAALYPLRKRSNE